MKRIIALLSLLPAAGMAESVVPWSVDTRIQEIISAVGPNWNVNATYKAVLIRKYDFASLYIFSGPFDQTPLAYGARIAITGEHWGTIPWLEFDESGALLVHSENRAFGRNKWDSTLTIIERDGRFIVSAFHGTGYDSLNPDDNFDCSIDMLAQTVTLNDKPITPFPLPPEIHIQYWSEEMEDVCYTETGN